MNWEKEIENYIPPMHPRMFEELKSFILRIRRDDIQSLIVWAEENKKELYDEIKMVDEDILKIRKETEFFRGLVKSNGDSDMKYALNYKDIVYGKIQEINKFIRHLESRLEKLN
jgi:hypothetical protein